MSDPETKSDPAEQAAATATTAEGDAPEASEAPAEASEAKAEEPAAAAEPAEPAPAKAAEPAKPAPAKAAEPAKPAPAKEAEKSSKRPPKPKKAEPAAPAEGAPKKERTARLGEEEEPSPLNVLFENLPTVIVLMALGVLIPVWWTYSGQASAENRQAAWDDYGTAAKQDLAQANFAELIKKHSGTTAEPYFKIKWAAKLYETGVKANVEQALGLYREIKRDHGNLPLVAQLMDDRIKQVEAELADPSAVWASAAAAPGGASLAPPTSAGP